MAAADRLSDNALCNPTRLLDLRPKLQRHVYGYAIGDSWNLTLYTRVNLTTYSRCRRIPLGVPSEALALILTCKGTKDTVISVMRSLHTTMRFDVAMEKLTTLREEIGRVAAMMDRTGLADAVRELRFVRPVALQPLQDHFRNLQKVVFTKHFAGTGCYINLSEPGGIAGAHGSAFANARAWRRVRRFGEQLGDVGGTSNVAVEIVILEKGKARTFRFESVDGKACYTSLDETQRPHPV